MFLVLLALFDGSMSLKVNEPINKATVTIPKATQLNDISEAEMQASDMEPVKHKNFGVSVMLYNKRQYDFVSNTFRANKEWEGVYLNKLCDSFKKHGGKGNFMDIGGNIGTLTLPMASCLKENGNGNNKVITVEGAPWNARHIRAGMKYNNLDNVRLYEYAVGDYDEPAKVQMVSNMDNKGGSRAVVLMEKPHDGKPSLQAQVPMTTIDNISEDAGDLAKNVFAMKMDIEGHEWSALRGASKFLQNGPCIILVELGAKNLNQGLRLQALIEKHGYTLKNKGGPDNMGWFYRTDRETCTANLV